MPLWYFEKSELLNTPSLRDGIPPETENRYRREGARFIMDCGNSIGLYKFYASILLFSDSSELFCWVISREFRRIWF